MRGSQKEALSTLASAPAGVCRWEKREFCLFWGHQPSEDGQLTKSCLSQWWMEDFWSITNTYLCMEQYMMAAKAELFGNNEIQEQILKCSDPKQIKALAARCGVLIRRCGTSSNTPLY